MKLNTTHIEQLRKYFFSKNEEEYSAVGNNMEETELLSFIQVLKQAFNNTEEKAVSTLLKNTGNDSYLNDLLQVQQDYYSQLAMEYVSGISNADIETLVTINHPAFFDEVTFQKELNTALKLRERINLKNQFQQIDDVSGINTKEINAAFKLEERKRLKEQFQAMDNEAVKNRPESKVVAFNWKRFAVAASLSVLILTITFLLFNKNKKQPGLADTRLNDQHISDSIFNRGQKQKEINNVLNRTEVAFTERKDTIVRELSFGFVEKPEITIIQLHDLGIDISKIDQILNDIKRINGFERAADSLRAKKDSIKKLEYRYRFHSDTLSIHLSVKKEVKVYKLNSAYFIRVGQDVYYCKESFSYSNLKLADKASTDKIKEMTY